jgi:lipopolysaccharide transport system ATP-binding protein
MKMSDLAIRVEDLGKLYRLGKRERYKALRDTLTDLMIAPWRAARSILRVGESNSSESGENSSIWALKDLSFEVRHGEVVGVIGRNGAGKSTLLKILSRITEPTEGSARIRGRVGSLLEVGTGFHPELTGRENIYLSGAILGMHRQEIERKFDEIIAFAEVERFVDTPVKHYSSGMYLRLAFAVAAHLEPEILLVDEVLAVGDAAFQKKSLGKMSDVAKQGRTVLFVSHNMPSITMLCTRALLLSEGHLVQDDEASRVVGYYLSSESKQAQAKAWQDWRHAPGSELIRLRSARIMNLQEQMGTAFRMDDPIRIELTYWLLKPGLETNVGYHLYNSQGILVFVAMDLHDPECATPKGEGIYKSVCEIPGGFLNQGNYWIDAAVSLAATNRPEVFVKGVAGFEVSDVGPSEVRGRFVGPWSVGVLRPKLNWKTTRLE